MLYKIKSLDITTSGKRLRFEIGQDDVKGIEYVISGSFFIITINDIKHHIYAEHSISHIYCEYFTQEEYIEMEKKSWTSR